MLGAIGVLLVGAVVAAVVLVVVGMRAPEARDPIQARLAEFSVREEPLSLEEIELSQGFYDRIVLPFFNSVGKVSQRFTPQATLQSTRRKLEMGGNPMRMDACFFLHLRLILAVVFGGLIFIVFLVTGRNWVQGLAATGVFLLLGFMFPELWLSRRILPR